MGNQPPVNLPVATSVSFVAAAQLPTPFGIFQIRAYREQNGDREHLALVRGDLRTAPPLLRLHSECLTGDALFSLRCDCGFQLHAAFQAIAEAGVGVVLYLRQEGRGIGLINKIRAYELQDAGADTVEANHQLGFPADARDFSIAVAMLEDLGVNRVRLMTNNPDKMEALRHGGIEIVERVPLQSGRNPYNAGYLDAKALKMGHLLPMDGGDNT